MTSNSAPVVWLLLALFCAPLLADHPTDLDHLLRQVKESNDRESTIRREREQRFLAAHADRKKLLETESAPPFFGIPSRALATVLLTIASPILFYNLVI